MSCFVAAGPIACRHHYIAHRVVLTQRLFDLAKLDPEAANFNLLIQPPKKLDAAICGAPHEIAGAIEPRSTIAADWIDDELSFCQRRVVYIPCADSGAGDT